MQNENKEEQTTQQIEQPTLKSAVSDFIEFTTNERKKKQQEKEAFDAEVRKIAEYLLTEGLRIIIAVPDRMVTIGTCAIKSGEPQSWFPRGQTVVPKTQFGFIVKGELAHEAKLTTEQITMFNMYTTQIAFVIRILTTEQNIQDSLSFSLANGEIVLKFTA